MSNEYAARLMAEIVALYDSVDKDEAHILDLRDAITRNKVALAGKQEDLARFMRANMPEVWARLTGGGAP